jgi:hypothetical protein
MPFYSVTATMIPTSNAPRGREAVQSEYFFSWDNNSDALGDLPSLVSYFSEGDLAKRWLIVRESPIHSLTLYRRDETSRKVRTPLNAITWQLEAPDTFSIPIFGVPLVAVNAPLWPHQRGAVLCVSKGADPTHTRRVYVGPVSPWYGNVVTDLPLVPAAFSGVPGSTGDYPYNYTTDRIDVHRTDFGELVRDWVHFMDGAAPNGIQVVPSWKKGSYSPIGETRFSPVRAEIRSRGWRVPMSEPAT